MRTYDNCAFCDHQGLQNRTVERNDTARAILSAPKLAEAACHLLIIPYDHKTRLDTITEDTRHAMVDLEAEMSRRLLKMSDGVQTFSKTQPGSKNGDNGGTVMRHFHRHVVGTHKGTHLHEKGFEWGMRHGVWVPLGAMDRDDTIKALKDLG